jgi:hypothetical protein
MSKASILGLYDDLPLCLRAGDPWVEHGIVEHRYKLLRPKIYGQLLRDYSHAAIAPKDYTASSFLAGALSRLSKDGVLGRIGGRATGYWRYLRGVSYWALLPEPPADERLTWKDFAISEGLDPDNWVLDGVPG